jgi:TRAP-type C4-dicarboxylate transport system substrate-binding protein
VAKFYSLNEHTAVPDVLFMSLYTWNRLSEEDQKIIRKAALESAKYQRVLWAESTLEALENVVKEGVTVIRPDKKPFKDKLESMYQDYYEESPEMERVIKSILDKQVNQ